MRDSAGPNHFILLSMGCGQSQDQVAIVLNAREVPMKFHVVPSVQVDLSWRVIKEGAVKWMESVERDVMAQAPWYCDFQRCALPFINSTLSPPAYNASDLQ
jgi:hypothetical protein